VARGHAHVLDVVGAHALLGGGGARHLALRLRGRHRARSVWRQRGGEGAAQEQRGARPRALQPIIRGRRRARAWRTQAKARGQGRTWPRNTGLNWSMPAMVSSTVGSSGTRELLGSRLWPLDSK
jgi:hypothetical protein